MDLFERFDEVVNDEFIEKFKSYTNEPNANYKAAISGVFYTLLAGMIRKTYSDMSAGMLINQIQENTKKVSLPNNLSSIFTQESVLEKVKYDGSKIISQIFPAYKSPLLSVISTYSGASKTTTTLAANIAANVLISLFKKEVEEGKLDKEQMVSLLRQHHEPLLNKIPENLLEKMIPALGLQELMTVRPYSPKKEKADASIPVKIKEDETPGSDINYEDLNNSSSMSSTGWLIVGIAGLLVVGGAIYYYLNQNGDLGFFSKKEVPVESTNSPDSTVMVLDSNNIMADTTAGDKVNQNEISNFEEYILNKGEAAGKEFDFKSITFISDSTAVNSESEVIVKKIADLMRENPKLQLKISAFSNSTVDRLNIKRAFFVKRILMNSEIDPIRIDAVSGGTGDELLKIKVISK